MIVLSRIYLILIYNRNHGCKITVFCDAIMCLYSDKSGTFSDGKKFLCEENANFATDMSRAKYKLWKITRYGLSGETDLREGVGKIVERLYIAPM